MNVPTEPATQRPPFHRTDIVGHAVLFCLVGMISAVWLETDLYRVAMLPPIALGIWVYFSRRDFRPAIGPMGWACLVWAHYVALRYLWILLTRPDSTGGSAEGIYLMPALYMTVGYVLFLYRDKLAHLVWVFMAISLAALLASTDLIAVFQLDSGLVPFLFQKNTIHSSVGAGLILIAAFCFALWLLTRSDLPGRIVWAGLAVALLIGILAVLGIFGAKSKGVWIALLVTAPSVVAATFAQMRGKARWAVMAGFMCVSILAVLIFHDIVWHTIGRLVVSAVDLAQRLVSGMPVRQMVLEAIDSGTLPYTLDARIRVWWNALSIWRLDWLFGQGIWWENLWQQTRFADIGYELMHNGYLEIAVRFGLFGLEFYAVLLAWCFYQATAAVRRGLIPLELYFFYLLTMIFFLASMLSNSNIRLAVGESYMLMAGGFGFCCYYLRQAAARAP